VLTAHTRQRPRALLAVHWQNEVLHPDGAIRAGFAESDARRAQVLAASKQLLAAARANAVATIFLRMAFRADFADLPANCALYRGVAERKVMAEGSWGADFHAGLAPAPTDWVVTHNRVNGFYASQLEAQLAALGVRDLIVAGVATHSAVEHTVRHAADMGFNVSVAEEACAATPREVHLGSLNVMASLATIVTVREACAMLDKK
jgi:nicotinamidase-related amidase